jgi:hypothetical protein
MPDLYRRSESLNQLLGHLADRPWGKTPRSIRTWHAAVERGLATRVGDHTVLTEAGRRVVARLEAERVVTCG